MSNKVFGNERLATLLMKVSQKNKQVQKQYLTYKLNSLLSQTALIFSGEGWVGVTLIVLTIHCLKINIAHIQRDREMGVLRSDIVPNFKANDQELKDC